MLITVFGNRLLPAAVDGTSQNFAFGFMILVLPVFLLERVIGDIWGLRLWSGGVAFFGWSFITSLQGQTRLDARGANNLLAAALVSVRPLQEGIWCNTYRANSDASQLWTNQNSR